MPAARQSHERDVAAPRMRKDRGGSGLAVVDLVNFLNGTAGRTGSATGRGSNGGHVVHGLSHRNGLVEIAMDVEPRM